MLINFQSTPIHSNPIHSNPLHSTPIHSTPIQSNPIQSNPIQSNRVKSNVLQSYLGQQFNVFASFICFKSVYNRTLQYTFLFFPPPSILSRTKGGPFGRLDHTEYQGAHSRELSTLCLLTHRTET